MMPPRKLFRHSKCCNEMARRSSRSRPQTTGQVLGANSMYRLSRTAEFLSGQIRATAKSVVDALGQYNKITHHRQVLSTRLSAVEPKY